MEPAYLLPELLDLAKHIESLMSKLRPHGESSLGKPLENGIWWRLSSAQGAVDNAIGKVMRYRDEKDAEEVQP